MNVFLDMEDTAAVNLNKIKAISLEGEKALKISFDDGTAEVYDIPDSAEKAAERFGKMVVKIMPCHAPFYNVYKKHGGGYSHERVYFLAVCADGMIRSYAAPSKYRALYLADVDDKFVGYFNESDLAKYPIKNANED
jgi:hypothetical protein